MLMYPQCGQQKETLPMPEHADNRPQHQDIQDWHQQLAHAPHNGTSNPQGSDGPVQSQQLP